MNSLDKVNNAEVLRNISGTDPWGKDGASCNCRIRLGIILVVKRPSLLLRNVEMEYFDLITDLNMFNFV